MRNTSLAAVQDAGETRVPAAAARVLLLVDRKENRRLLESELSGKYEVLESTDGDPFARVFDLVLLDAAAIHRYWDAVLERKRAEEPVFLPVLLLVSPEEALRLPAGVWERIDDVLEMPVRKASLRARMQVLLRTRRFSLDLKMHTDDLEAFMRAMTHELRAPSRVVSEFARALAEDHAVLLDADARRYVDRIVSACAEMDELVDCLLDLSRMGHGEVTLQPVPVDVVLKKCLETLREEIRSHKAVVEVKGRMPQVNADPHLLRIGLSNLLSNALKYVAPGTRPRVTITSTRARGVCRIRVADNGIGISPADQDRIFKPFIRLHGIEEYPGSGLGLAAARKAMTLLGGRIGVTSSPGRGSNFWLELNC